MPCLTHTILFDTVAHAYAFVERVHIALKGDVATFRDGTTVLVYDAVPGGAYDRIQQLARSSSGNAIKTQW